MNRIKASSLSIFPVNGVSSLVKRKPYQPRVIYHIPNFSFLMSINVMAGKCEQTIYIYIKLILWPGTVKGISYSLILVDIL